MHDIIMYFTFNNNNSVQSFIASKNVNIFLIFIFILELFPHATIRVTIYVTQTQQTYDFIYGHVIIL